MKLIYTPFLLFFVLSCSKFNKVPITKKEYLDEVLNIVEKHSINRDSTNFDKIRKTTYEKLKYTDSLKDCYTIVQSILSDLGDNHSFFMTKEQVDNWQSSKNNTNELITFSGKLLNGNIGYIEMKGFSSGDSISIQKYADSLQHKIGSIDNIGLKGWIIDLRKNTGGNCWPMLTGLGPLLGNGVCGYFIDNNGEKESWFYRDGKSGMNNSTIVKTSAKPYQLLNNTVPIAILTGYNTSSSGEVVVTAFHNKENTKSFGESTAGLSTGNAGFKLSDGSMIFLTASIFADRKGTIFGSRIKPDVVINFYYDLIGTTNDPVIIGAIDWICKEKQKRHHNSG